MRSATGDAPRGLGYEFGDPALLLQALRHRSAGSPHNERMEFLGDALLGAIIAEELSQRLPRSDEGELTRVRSSVVRESTLADVARSMGLGDVLQLGGGELKSGGRRRDSILADSLEAVIAAIYLDGGWQACCNQVREMFDAAIDRAISARNDRDAKTLLQEWLQSRQRALPEYELLDATGPDHEREFSVRCRLAEPPHSAEASASSRKLAETEAARRLCVMLGVLPPTGSTNGQG